MKKLSISEVAALVGQDRRTVARKLEHLQAEPGPRGAKAYPSPAALRAVYAGPGTGLDPAQERAQLDRARRVRMEMELNEKCGALLPVGAHEVAMAEMARQVVMTLDTLPDVLERDAGISGAAVARCQAVIDNLRDDLANRVAAAATKRQAAEDKERARQG